MDRQTELSLIDEILTLKSANSAFLNDAAAINPASHYTCPKRFADERTHVFRPLPKAAAHISELSEEDAFVRRDVAGQSILLTRDASGHIHAFLNACRHRGTRLVDDDRGCRKRFSCPYHAWTYANSGELIGAPHFEQGFPDMEKAALSLRPLNCAVRFGIVWVWSQTDQSLNIDDHFRGLDDELDALAIADMKIAAEDASVRGANWKIFVEGGIEAYHFRVAHRNTIGPHFEDNLSSYRCFGSHMRAVLPRTSMAKLCEQSRNSWKLREHANVLYTLFPTCQFLVMQDHIVWITSEPKSPEESTLRIVTLAPVSGPLAEGKDAEHWTRNHEITMATLDEDFLLGESIQATVASGACERMLFGRFEGALEQFRLTVEQQIADNARQEALQDRALNAC